MTENNSETSLAIIDIDRRLNSLQGLEVLEDQVLQASRDMGDARDRFAYSLHLILEYKLWRHRKIKDTGNQVFIDQQEYLEYLAERCLAAISTMKAYHGAIRLAKHIGYDTMEAVSQIGLGMFLDLRDRVEVERKTGKPTALKYGPLPEGKEIKQYLKEIVEDVASTESVSLRPYDRRRALDQHLCANVPRIEYDIPDVLNNPGYVTWHVEMYDNDGMLVDIPGNHGPFNRNTPNYVRQDFAKRLGVAWKLKE